MSLLNNKSIALLVGVCTAAFLLNRKRTTKLIQSPSGTTSNPIVFNAVEKLKNEGYKSEEITPELIDAAIDGLDYENVMRNFYRKKQRQSNEVEKSDE